MITCGPTGSTGQQIADEINRLGALPISSVYSTVPLTTLNLTTTYQNVVLGNAGGAIRGVLANTAFTTFTIPTTGIYEMVINLAVEIPNNVDVIVEGFVNALSFDAANAVVTGKGVGHQVILPWSYIANLTAADVISIKAKAFTGTTTMQVMASSVTLRAL